MQTKNIAFVTLCASILVALTPILPWWVESSEAFPNNIPYAVVPLISACFIYNRRNFIGAPGDLRFHPIHTIPLVLLLIALLCFHLAQYYFASSITLVFILFLSMRLFWEESRARHMNFPILFLLFTLPWNEILSKWIGFPLRTFAAVFADIGLRLLGLNSTREGTLVFTDKFQMIVEPACSGLSYTFALFYTGALLSVLTSKYRVTKAIILLSIFPVAVVANGMRVLSIGLIGHFMGREIAESVFHDYGGLILFGFALVILFGIIVLVGKLESKLDKNDG